MELFGAKFSIALGAWKLRFVFMLEEPEAGELPRQGARAPHHLAFLRDTTNAR